MSVKRLLLPFAAVAAVLTLAACGGGGGEEEPNLGPAQMSAANAAAAAALAATAAADAAGDAAAAAAAAATAASTALAAADAQTANMGADPASYGVARNAVTRAQAAATAASEASGAAQTASAAAAAANTAAQAAKTAADNAQTLEAAEAAARMAATAQTQAEMAKGRADTALANALAAKGDADTEQGNAEMYAGMVQTAQEAIDAENQRVIDVAAARLVAMGSYEAAEGDATKAEMAANDAETAAPGSPGAMAARAAATAARTAADAAKAAHDAITDGMTKAEADAQAKLAKDEADKANAGYMTAKLENDDIQTTGSQIAENNRKNAVAAARRYGGMAVDNAMSAATDARAAANAAKTAYDDANAEYMRAMSARTDSTNAKKHADTARAAYTAANSAANAARDAYMAAEAAVDGVMDDTSMDDANTARDTAEMQEGIAMGHETTAMTKQMEAETALGNAMDYADRHVLAVFMAANAYHITAEDVDLTNTDLNESVTEANEAQDKARAGLIGRAMAAIAEAADTAGNRGNSVADDTAVTVRQVTALWPAQDRADVEATEDVDEFLPGVLRIQYSDTATDRSETVGQDADGNPSTNDANVNAMKIAGTDDFEHGFDIFPINADGDRMARGVRVLAFTDREQAVTARTAVPAIEVENFALTGTDGGQIDEIGSKVGDRYPVAEFDHDSDDDTPPLSGYLSCPDGENCSITITDGDVVAADGYVFTGSRPGVEGITADLNTDYLVFGMWLEQLADSTDGNPDIIAFGAFANGGTPFPTANIDDGLEGTATYNGDAVGTHQRTGAGVSFFSGDATLTADFGTATEAGGSIEGRISNIRVDGGPAMSESIHLVETPFANSENTFSGVAVMGAQSRPGQTTHAYNGYWDGGFYNPVADNMDTADVNEAEDTAPGSVAGTFGVTRTMDMDTMATDDDVTESFVGAFGAHRDEDDN